MKLYHGSNIEIVNPDLNIGREKVDFGKGFYTTTIKDQAEKWAINKIAQDKINGIQSISIVSEYEFTENEWLFEKTFNGYNEDWLMFVTECRRTDLPSINHGYDVIRGNIADDNVVKTINDWFKTRLVYDII
jgi:hypothetical protein